ncbi:Uncharacterised protein [Mycobacteroides abscessus subsp. abscessus]|nr:Uncharacterised protein [Mycobacteroides abscessus subsp. abscessus]
MPLANCLIKQKELKDVFVPTLQELGCGFTHATSVELLPDCVRVGLSAEGHDSLGGATAHSGRQEGILLCSASLSLESHSTDPPFLDLPIENSYVFQQVKAVYPHEPSTVS